MTQRVLDWDKRSRIVYGPLALAVPLIAAAGGAAATGAVTVGTALTAASAGMTILGALGQSQAQRQAGDVSYQNALLRQTAANTQADQLQAAAGARVAAGQRDQIESLRRGQIMASRMRAVMGASGAGEDPNLIASLQGEGKYAGDVAAFNAGEQARGLTNEAAMTRWSGDAGVWSGENDVAAANSRANATLIGGIGASALSFASKYGGGGFSGGGNTPYADVGALMADKGIGAGVA